MDTIIRVRDAKVNRTSRTGSALRDAIAAGQPY
jgi:hypothetical protein